MPQAAGGFVLTLAILNGWLAARRGRSAVRWGVASILLAPFAWILTLYLAVGLPTGGVRGEHVSQIWAWLKLGALAVGAAIVIFAVLNALGGLPAGGAST